MLEGDHLHSHWMNVGRTLTQSNRRLNGSNKIQPIGKTAIPIDTSPAGANTSWRSTAELTTNMKIAVGSESELRDYKQHLRLSYAHEQHVKELSRTQTKTDGTVKLFARKSN